MINRDRRRKNLEEVFNAAILKARSGNAYTNVFDNLVQSAISQKDVAVLERLADFFREEGQYKDEFKVLEHVLALKESAFSQEKNEKVKELKKSFESKEKDKLIAQEQDFNEALKIKNTALSEALARQKRLDLHLKSLQLQLSPHFIFNTLQSIQSYIFQQDPVEASDYLAKFAKLMRAILKASRQDAISLADEVSLLTQYLSLEQKRFDDNFDFSIEVANEIDTKTELLPSLLLQPFIENAILHGLARVNKGKVNLIFRKSDNLLYVHIVDSGIGRKAAQKIKKNTHQGSATALKIMNERVHLSKESKRFSYDFNIRNRKRDNKVIGTHVLIAITSKIKEEKI